jgi:uncharacterized protein
VAAAATLGPVGRTTDTIDLGRLSLSPGEGRRVDVLVRIDPFEFGGQGYAAAPDAVEARVEAARTMRGYSLRLRFDANLSGPCMRCLEAARPLLSVDTREVDQPGDGDELESPYVAGDTLDVHAWARDALALELPAQIVCRDDCRGICSVCGENLNSAGPDHHHEVARDPRWSKLSELRFE